MSSIALFVDRAQTVLPDFQLTERNAVVVSQLCDYLEGLPLAIELAAARVSVLSPARILEQVQANRLDFLATRRRDADSRQRTLRATLDWSYLLLPEPAQRLLAQVSVFHGGWTLAAAQAVSQWSEADTLDMLVQVVDEEEGIRFTLMETVRVYAAEQLERLGEQEEIRRCHALYFLELAEESEPHLGVPFNMDSEQAIWLARLETEHENLRAALGWCLETEEKGKRKKEKVVEESLSPEEVGLRMAGALRWFWEVHGHLSEGRAYLAAALGQKGIAGLMPWRAKALGAAGRLALNQGDYPTARELLEQSLALFRQLGDKSNFGRSLINLGLVMLEQGDYKVARQLLEEGLANSRALGSKYGIAWALLYLGRMADEQSDFRAARNLLEQSLAIFREFGYRLGIALTLHHLGLAVSHQGEYETANRLYEQSLVICVELGDKTGIANSLHNQGLVAREQGDYGAARTLCEQGLAIRRELGEKSGIAHSLYGLGRMVLTQGEYEKARTLFQESLALLREMGHSHIIHVLGALGHVAREVGDYAGASALYQESLRLRQERGDVLATAQSLEDFACLAGRQGQPERAVRLLGGTEALAATLGRTLPVAEVLEYERTVAATHAALSEEAFASIWEEGRAMTLEQAVAYALEEGAASVQEAGA